MLHTASSGRLCGEKVNPRNLNGGILFTTGITEDREFNPEGSGLG